MTDKIVLKPEIKTKPAAPKHFEELWETSEKLFDAEKLNVDSILNELQAKISLYRMLGTGSFDADELMRTKTALMGKILVAMTKLSLKENVNTFLALQQGIEETKLMNMEAGVSKEQSSGGFDRFFEELGKQAKTSDGVPISGDILKDLKTAMEKLVDAKTEV
jgi:hypothetical protein